MSSKRPTSNLNTSGNTLFNYFARSPSTPKSEKTVAKPPASPLTSKPSTPTSSKSGANGKKYSHLNDNISALYIQNNKILIYSSILIVRKAIEEKKIETKKPKIENPVDSDDDSEEEVIKVKGKRKIACLDDSDSDYKNDENESDNSQDDIKSSRKKSTNGNATAKKKIKLDANGKKSSFEAKLKANVDESRTLLDVNENENTDILDVPVVYKHKTYTFLWPENIRDAEKRRPDHPNYDPTTLFVPKEHLDSLTPVNFISLSLFIYLLYRK